MSQLPADCLNEIFEHLEDDRFTLHSCILVNRYWCNVSVRIFWRNVWNYCTSNFSTLIACLPNESKEILYNNGIVISTPTLKAPTFNYASFCKVLSVNRVRYKIEKVLKNQHISPQSLENYTLIVVQEIFLMFMKEISSLRSLTFYSYPNMTFNLYLIEAKDCLKNLAELWCNSDISTELFHQLSQTCFNIQTLTIEFEGIISSGIADLISVQRNLKWFVMKLCYGLTLDGLSTDIIFSSLMSKIPNTLIKLDVYGRNNHFSLPFITNLSNLQELNLSFDQDEYFEKLQYAIFSQLQVLKIPKKYPRNGLLIKFLERNGKTLKEIYISEIEGCSDNSLNLAIAKFCPNLKQISVGIKELETLKIIFHSCKNLKSIKIWCGWKYLSEKEALEAFAKYSQNTYELILYQFEERFELLPEELESFFMKWTDREPQKSFSLVVVKYDAISLDTNDENIEIINKYIKLGVIKKFKVTDFEDEEYN